MAILGLLCAWRALCLWPHAHLRRASLQRFHGAHQRRHPQHAGGLRASAGQIQHRARLSLGRSCAALAADPTHAVHLSSLQRHQPAVWFPRPHARRPLGDALGAWPRIGHRPLARSALWPAAELVGRQSTLWQYSDQRPAQLGAFGRHPARRGCAGGTGRRRALAIPAAVARSLRSPGADRAGAARLGADGGWQLADLRRFRRRKRRPAHQHRPFRRPNARRRPDPAGQRCAFLAGQRLSVHQSADHQWARPHRSGHHGRSAAGAKRPPGVHRVAGTAGFDAAPAKRLHRRPVWSNGRRQDPPADRTQMACLHGCARHAAWCRAGSGAGRPGRRESAARHSGRRRFACALPADGLVRAPPPAAAIQAARRAGGGR